MDTQRTFDIILTELVLDNLKLQERLISTINSNDTIEDKVSNVKNLLERIVLNESITIKFKSLLPNSDTTPKPNQ